MPLRMAAEIMENARELLQNFRPRQSGIGPARPARPPAPTPTALNHSAPGVRATSYPRGSVKKTKLPSGVAPPTAKRYLSSLQSPNLIARSGVASGVESKSPAFEEYRSPVNEPRIKIPRALRPPDAGLTDARW